MKKKRGEGYISVCVLLIIVCMILSVFITFASAVNIVKQTERNSRVVLDNLVMRGAIDTYQSIKKGNDENALIDSQEYIDELCEFCTFDKAALFLYHKDANGKDDFRISYPQVGYSVTKKLKLYASYTVYVPIYFCGIQVSTATIPITVESQYIEKF